MCICQMSYLTGLLALPYLGDICHDLNFQLSVIFFGFALCGALLCIGNLQLIDIHSLAYMSMKRIRITLSFENRSGILSLVGI